MSRSNLAVVALVAGVLFGGAALIPSNAGWFDAPKPEVLFEATGPGLDPGVLVIRDSRSLELARGSVDPDYADEGPNLRTRTVLRIVGRERENACRETSIQQITTRMTKATVFLEERVAAPGCRCDPVSRPPAAWFVQVARPVRQAELLVDEVTVPCGTTDQIGASNQPALLLENSWDESPGARIISSPELFDRVLATLRLQERGPTVNFDTHAVVAVTGQARSNGCRRTKVLSVSASGKELAVTLEETFPAPNQMCTQIYNQPKVFLYRVPQSIETARVVTQKATAR